eukprot:gene1305-1647_t
MRLDGVTGAKWTKYKDALKAWIKAAGSCTQDMQAIISISSNSLVKRLSEGFKDRHQPEAKAAGTSAPPDAGAASGAPVNASRKAAGADAAVPAAAAADDPCDDSDSEGLQDILDKQLGTNSPELEAAADAAGLPWLPAGPGLLYSETREHGRRQRVVDCSSYRVGDHVDGSKEKPKEQLTVSCHDCQHQHVKWSCPHPHHRGQTSYCNRCLFKRYRATPWTLQDLHALCPLCRGACTCKACLRQPDHARRQPAVQYDSAHLSRCGQYVLRLVGGQLGAWLDRQEVEAAAGGFSCLSQLPVEKLLEQERTNCDRYVMYALPAGVAATSSASTHTVAAALGTSATLASRSFAGSRH